MNMKSICPVIEVLWDVAMLLAISGSGLLREKPWMLFTDPERGTVGQRIGFYKHLPPCGVYGSQIWWNQDITDTHRHPCGDSYEVKIIPHILGGGFKDFVCLPLPGEMIQFDKHFSNGLVQPPTTVYIPRKPIPHHPCAKCDAFFTPPSRSNFEAVAAGTRCKHLSCWDLFCASCISTWNPINN